MPLQRPVLSHVTESWQRPMETRQPYPVSLGGRVTDFEEGDPLSSYLPSGRRRWLSQEVERFGECCLQGWLSCYCQGSLCATQGSQEDAAFWVPLLLP